jgi:hypothetical protein
MAQSGRAGRQLCEQVDVHNWQDSDHQEGTQEGTWGEHLFNPNDIKAMILPITGGAVEPCARDSSAAIGPRPLGPQPKLAVTVGETQLMVVWAGTHEMTVSLSVLSPSRSSTASGCVWLPRA